MHLHIEGALPWDMVQARTRAGSLPSSPPWWATDYRFESFPQFAGVLRQCYENTLTSVDDYYAAARHVFQGLAAQNVRYVEISFSAGHALSRQLSLTGIVDAVKKAAPADLAVRVFCGVSRSRPHLLQDNATETILSIPALDGLDLHGDETALGPATFADLFAHARQRGLATKAHAGELAGAESVRDVIATLQVTRIEHGVRTIEDDELLRQLIAQGITLDLCPTSNIKLRVVEDIADYPIRRLHERGIRITVSTDNPTILGCSLSSELHLLVERFGFSLDDLTQLQRNAFQETLVSAAERTRLLTELDNVARTSGRRIYQANRDH